MLFNIIFIVLILIMFYTLGFCAGELSANKRHFKLLTEATTRFKHGDEEPPKTVQNAKKPGYIIAVSHYPNGRGHGAGYFAYLQYYDTFEEVLECVLHMRYDDEIMEVIRGDGAGVGAFEYEMEQSGHSVSGIIFYPFKDSGLCKMRTKDDGKGNLIWSDLQ